MGETSSARISPTAHYTGAVWVRHGLAPAAFGTPGGRVLFEMLRPSNALSAVFGGATLEAMLLARHRAIDRVLDRAIVEGRVGQVLEVASGLSGRGLRFVERHPELRFVESDLPGMVVRKRAVLAEADAVTDAGRLRVVELDVLRDTGTGSLAEVAARELDPARGLAIVTEGLLPYLAEDDVRGMWHRFAQALAGFPEGLYVTDVHLGEEVAAVPGVGVFLQALAVFARGRIHFPFADRAALDEGFRRAGFANVTAPLAGPPAETARVRVATAGA